MKPIIELAVRMAAAVWAAIVLMSILPACGKVGGGPPVASDAGAPRRRIVRVDPGALRRLGVEVEPAGTQAPEHRLHVTGSLDFNLTRYAEIGTLMDGRIMSISAGVGDRVKKGQVLCTLLVPQLAQTQAEYLSAQASAQVAREHATRENRLFEKELTTAQEVQAARAQQTKAEAELAAAQAKLEAIGAAAPRNKEHIVGAGRLSIASSIAGVVVRRDAVLGRYLHPNETAFVVADLSELWATLQIHESDLPYLQVGSDVELMVDAVPGQSFTGKLELVEPQINKASRTVRARVLVPNPGERLRPGLFVRAKVAIPESGRSDRLLIPTDAVQPLGDTDVVFVELSRGEFEVREIAIARRTAEVTEVAAGIQKGERIAILGTFLLRGEVTKQ